MKKGSTFLGTVQVPKKCTKKQKQDFWKENTNAVQVRHVTVCGSSAEDTCDGSQEDQTVGRVRWTIKKTLDQVCPGRAGLFGFWGT